MTFEIDTGHFLPATPQTAKDFIADWSSMLFHTADEKVLVQKYAQYVMGEITGPKKLETCRKHLVANWRFIRCLADEEPTIFDEILMAYAERQMS